MYREQEVVRSLREVVHREHRRATRSTSCTGQARFEDPHTVRVAAEGQPDRLLHGDVILIATGSVPTRPKDVPFDDPRVHDSDEILELERLPRSLAVIGGGVIGCEYASIFAALGIEVTLIDGRDRLLGFLDAEIADQLRLQMRFLGVDLRLQGGRDAATSPSPTACGWSCKSGGSRSWWTRCWWPPAAWPTSRGLGLERAGLAVNERGLLDGQRALPDRGAAHLRGRRRHRLPRAGLHLDGAGARGDGPRLRPQVQDARGPDLPAGRLHHPRGLDGRRDRGELPAEGHRLLRRPRASTAPTRAARSSATSAGRSSWSSATRTSRCSACTSSARAPPSWSTSGSWCCRPAAPSTRSSTRSSTTRRSATPTSTPPTTASAPSSAAPPPKPELGPRRPVGFGGTGRRPTAGPRAPRRDRLRTWAGPRNGPRPYHRYSCQAPRSAAASGARRRSSGAPCSLSHALRGRVAEAERGPTRLESHRWPEEQRGVPRRLQQVEGRARELHRQRGQAELEQVLAVDATRLLHDRVHAARAASSRRCCRRLGTSGFTTNTTSAPARPRGRRGRRSRRRRPRSRARRSCRDRRSRESPRTRPPRR